MWLRTGSDRSKRTELYVEILAEASTAADGVLWREPSDFSRWRFATLGLIFKSSGQFLSINSDPSLKKDK